MPSLNACRKTGSECTRCLAGGGQETVAFRSQCVRYAQSAASNTGPGPRDVTGRRLIHSAINTQPVTAMAGST